MITEKILEQVKREPRTLIYFGDNIAQFREVAEAVYPEYADISKAIDAAKAFIG